MFLARALPWLGRRRRSDVSANTIAVGAFLFGRVRRPGDTVTVSDLVADTGLQPHDVVLALRELLGCLGSGPITVTVHNGREKRIRADASVVVRQIQKAVEEDRRSRKQRYKGLDQSAADYFQRSLRMDMDAASAACPDGYLDATAIDRVAQDHAAVMLRASEGAWLVANLHLLPRDVI
jgi:hypothetical protein